MSITGSSIGRWCPYSIEIRDPRSENNNPILQITMNGEVYYSCDDEMVKVNCPDDISDAFKQCVLNMTGQLPEDVMIDKYLEKIFNNQRSDEYMNYHYTKDVVVSTPQAQCNHSL